ncbi:MAG: NUDIX hydrolase [Candidatus Gribaldobacteria bacterium]|nr:NUDIX hydrolase [Candidatus Gribaldobacteria bacterium]
MEIIKKEVAWEGKFVRVTNKFFKAKNGQEGVWEVVERKGLYKRIVFIFALTKNKEVVLEKNYRLTCECQVLELPAGLTDKPDESEAEAAKRELLEETGYQAKEMIPIFASLGAPGLTKSEYINFFAPDVEFVGKPENGEGEEIEVLTVPVDQLVSFLLEQQGKMKVDSNLLGILPILQHKGLI